MLCENLVDLYEKFFWFFLWGKMDGKFNWLVEFFKFNVYEKVGYVINSFEILLRVYYYMFKVVRNENFVWIFIIVV